MDQFDDDRLVTLVGLTYDAALDERLWGGLAGEIASTFEASSVGVRLRSSRTGKGPLLTSTDNLLASNAQEYTSHYWREDKWAIRGAELGISKVHISKELISDEELERSEWYCDWVRKGNIFYVMGVVLPVGGGDLVTIGIHRARSEGDFEKQDKRPFYRFLPHLKRALQLRRRLFADSIERDATSDALDRTGVATIVVAEDGLVLYANRRAEIMVREGDGLVAPHNRLRTSDHKSTEALSTAIKVAARIAAGESPTAPTRAFAVHRADRLPITVLVSPLRAARDGHGLPMPAAVVLARDPEWPNASRVALQSMFGLTAAEAGIARDLAKGQSANDISAAIGITLNTTRTHIKSIFAKTGTNRQPELVALLSTTVAFLDGHADNRE